MTLVSGSSEKMSERDDASYNEFLTLKVLGWIRVFRERNDFKEQRGILRKRGIDY